MPTINWIGKEKIVNHHLDIPYHTLDLKYTFDAADRFDNFLKVVKSSSENKIIHADNLLALKSLLPEYEGRIKCIYIDPPYNTGNEGWVYNDNVSDPKLKKWLGQVVGKEAEDLTRHDKWLCMMYPRLKLLHKLLAEDGIIYISIDDNEQSNLKQIMDELFGVSNFLATMFWRGMHTVRNSSKDFNKNTEYVICFAKNKSKLILESNANYFLRVAMDKAKDYKLNDEDGNGFYKLDPIYARNYATPYEFTFKNQIKWNAPRGSYPRYSIATLTSMDEKGQIVFTGKEPKAKRYLKDVQQGVPPSTLLEPSIVGFNKDATLLLNEIFGGEKMFDQPKPPTLIEFILQIQRKVDTNDFIVLDSFAGSGTTAHAILNLNKQDGGNRKFILIEREDYAETVTAERVKRVMQGYGNTEGTGGSFSYYTMGESLFDTDGNLNESLSIEKIRRYIYYTETKQWLSESELSEGNLKEKDNAAFLAKYNDTAYYFNYEADRATTLNHDFLSTIKTKAEQYIIYADKCLLTKEFMSKHAIIFKKIPRDITKF